MRGWNLILSCSHTAKIFRSKYVSAQSARVAEQKMIADDDAGESALILQRTQHEEAHCDDILYRFCGWFDLRLHV
jgi:hypothetical protein